MDTPLARAISIADGQSALARALSTEPGKVKQGHVWAWLNRDKRAPIEHCPAIEALTGIRCEELRPDIVWTRNTAGQVTGYHVAITASDPSRRTPAANEGNAADDSTAPLKAA